MAPAFLRGILIVAYHRACPPWVRLKVIFVPPCLQDYLPAAVWSMASAWRMASAKPPEQLVHAPTLSTDASGASARN